MINPNIVGTIAGICTAASLIPQIVKLFREKRADDGSYWMFGVLSTGVILWIWYGVMLQAPPVIYTNAASLLFNVIIISLKIKYRKPVKR